MDPNRGHLLRTVLWGVATAALYAGMPSNSDLILHMAHTTPDACVVAHGTEMTILGTHGRTGLDRLLMGSVTERVIGFAQCPVLAVRA